MDQAQTVKLNRGPMWRIGPFVLAAMWAYNAIMNAIVFGDPGMIALNLATVGIFTAGGLLSLRPYVTITPSHLIVNVAPARPNRSLPWDSIQAFERSGHSKLVLPLANDKPVSIYLSFLTQRDRNTLLATLDQRIGVVPQLQASD